MRVLHPVGIHEKFLASGVYVHYQGGAAAGTLEHWSIHELPDGAQLIRVDDDWREKDGSSVLTEAWRSPPTEGGHIERFSIHAFGGKEDAVKEIRLTYTFNGPFLEFGRTVDKGEREQMALELPEGYIASPKSLVFSGLEAGHVTTGQAYPVLSYLPTFVDAAAAFRPVLYYQTWHFVQDETLTLKDKPHQARRYHQESAPSQKNTLWVDANHILLKFESQDAQHSATLTRYAYRTDPPKKKKT